MRIALLLLCAVASAFAFGEAGHSVVGSGYANSGFATDAFPGFDDLDKLPKPEKKTHSWWTHSVRDTAEAQMEYADSLAKEGNARKAKKAYDALVRDWPASPLAPKAQYRLAELCAESDDYDDAFEALEYLLDFYPFAVENRKLVEMEYRLTDLMIANKRTWFGMSFTSDREVRQHYESIVRRAPGEKYVPEAYLKIGKLREDHDEFEKAADLYGAFANKYPQAPEAAVALYREAVARMWMCRRMAYNLPRCKDTLGFLKRLIVNHPELPEAEEIRIWAEELTSYLEEDAYRRAKFYDSRTRTRHAAICSWREFLRDYPKSKYADEVNARIIELSEPITHAAEESEK